MVAKNIMLITGPDLRHRYYINHLNYNFKLAGVLIEPTDYPQVSPQTAGERSAWDWFFSRRQSCELKAFAGSENLAPQNNPAITRIPSASINTDDTVKIINKLNPGLIALFGTSIVGKELMDLYPQRIFNLHVGLTGNYRGSSCNFWPIHDRRLDLLGATIIRVNSGIDSGEILAQKSVALEENDDEQSLAAKTIILGTQLMVDAIKTWLNNALRPSYPSGRGKLFLQKQFSPGPVIAVRQMVERGELKELLKIQINKNKAKKKNGRTDRIKT